MIRRIPKQKAIEIINESGDKIDIFSNHGIGKGKIILLVSPDILKEYFKDYKDPIFAEKIITGKDKDKGENK